MNFERCNHFPSRSTRASNIKRGLTLHSLVVEYELSRTPSRRRALLACHACAMYVFSILITLQFHSAIPEPSGRCALILFASVVKWTPGAGKSETSPGDRALGLTELKQSCGSVARDGALLKCSGGLEVPPCHHSIVVATCLNRCFPQFTPTSNDRCSWSRGADSRRAESLLQSR